MTPDEQLPVEPDATEQPTPEQIEEYVEKLEEYDREEQAVALQAQADLAEGQRQMREEQMARVKALRRAFKGIYSRPQIITLATVGLLRTKALQDAEIERQKAEQEASSGE